MTDDHGQQVRSLFDEAIERPTPERGVFLDREAPNDPALRAEVQSLLDAYQQAEDFLEPPGTPIAPRDEAPATGFPVIANYRIVRLLGEGGMGVVYEAEQEHPRRRVAVKVIRKGQLTDRRALRLFEREIQTLARLTHPGIASVHEAGHTAGGAPFFAMELVSGVPVDEYVQRLQPSRSDGLRLFQRICHAVHYAHCRAVIHRDLKPSNILVDEAGNAKILDFGLAKLTDSDVAATTSETDYGRIQGTLPYMSPEQVRGDPQEIDLLTDVYALGVMLYELLTSQRPYDTRGHALPETVRSICETSPRRPRTINPTLPKDLETIVLKAMEKDRTRRYQSAAECAADIERFLSGQPVLARMPSTLYQLRKLISRHRVSAGLLAILLVSLGLFAGWMTVMYRGAERLRVTAESALGREQKERERAEAAEHEARMAANSAEQISRFLQDMLSSIDPAIAQGRDTTLLRQLLEQASERVEKELAEEPQVQAAVRRTIGWTYSNLGILDKAEDQLRAALEIQRGAFEDPHPETARILHRLAAVLSAQARYEESATLFEDALLAMETLFGEGSSEYVEALADYAWLRILEGEYSKAESMLRRCKAIQGGMRTENPEGVARVLNDLATVRYYQGAYDEAEQQFNEALAIRRTVLPKIHPFLAISLNNLAALLQARGDYQAAEPLYRESLAIRRQLMGDAHPDVANSLNNLGVTLRRQQRWDESEACFREALDIFRRAHGDQHPAIATTLANIGGLLMERGQVAAAREPLEQSLAMRRSIYTAPHPDVAASLLALGELDLQQGDAAAAEELLREALQIRVVTLPPDHWLIAQAQSVLGSCLTARGLYTEAEPLLLGAYEALRTTRGARDRHTMASLRHLVTLYEAWGRKDRAAEMSAALSALGSSPEGSP